MSSESRKTSTPLLVFLVLWLGILTILAVTPIGRDLTQQPAGAEQSTRRMLCADALERRQAAEKVLMTGTTTEASKATWVSVRKVAQAQLDQANADKGAYCR